MYESGSIYRLSVALTLMGIATALFCCVIIACKKSQAEPGNTIMVYVDGFVEGTQNRNGVSVAPILNPAAGSVSMTVIPTSQGSVEVIDVIGMAAMNGTCPVRITIDNKDDCIVAMNSDEMELVQKEFLSKHIYKYRGHDVSVNYLDQETYEAYLKMFENK